MGRVRDLQYIFAVTSGSPSMYSIHAQGTHKCPYKADQDISLRAQQINKNKETHEESKQAMNKFLSLAKSAKGQS